MSLRSTLVCLVLASSSAIGAQAQCPKESTLPGALVSAQWLDSHLCRDDIVVVDIRSESDYKKSHVLKSVSIPFALNSAWSVTGEDDLLLEMPPAEDLFESLALAGISNPSPETKVVLVTASTPGSLEAGPRVAATLQLAGISEGRVAILNGGFDAWGAVEFAVSTLVRRPEPGSFSAKPDTDFVVDMDYVAAALDRDDVVLVDARAEELFVGQTADGKADAKNAKGHISGAVSLPSSLIWTEDGHYRSEGELRSSVSRALGSKRAGEMSKDGEVIIYCSTGGKAAGWHFVLSRVLGYKNVKIYDGSIQEWSRHHELVVENVRIMHED